MFCNGFEKLEKMIFRVTAHHLIISFCPISIKRYFFKLTITISIKQNCSCFKTYSCLIYQDVGSKLFLPQSVPSEFSHFTSVNRHTDYVDKKRTVLLKNLWVSPVGELYYRKVQQITLNKNTNLIKTLTNIKLYEHFLKNKLITS